ncbi:MAG: methyltransferase domain-containing protein [Candidatus Aminicenantes bacterium]|nr:methyltransferase domain-containing protein [Candidatus Aminicenantes bacterium]
MKKPYYIREALLVFCLFFTVTCSAFAQNESPQEQFVPQSGQEGKDVVWVPTPQELVEKMLDLAEVTPDDYVIDLGSGDGRTVIAAAKRGAQALGIEYNPKMVELSSQYAEAEGVSKRAKFIVADLFETDLSKATVITMFLLTSINRELRPKILNLKPGTRIVSNTFTMGDWECDDSATVDSIDSTYDTALLWIVPAKVAGIWQFDQAKLTLIQDFQMISGSLEIGSSTIPIEEGKLHGSQISFSTGEEQYNGQVNGNTIEGIITSKSNNRKWNAVLVSK